MGQTFRIVHFQRMKKWTCITKYCEFVIVVIFSVCWLFKNIWRHKTSLTFTFIVLYLRTFSENCTFYLDGNILNNSDESVLSWVEINIEWYFQSVYKDDNGLWVACLANLQQHLRWFSTYIIVLDTSIVIKLPPRWMFST